MISITTSFYSIFVILLFDVNLTKLSMCIGMIALLPHDWPTSHVDRPCAERVRSVLLQVQAQKKRQQQHELIAELRRRQAKDHRPVYEGKDGTIEDIITGGKRRTANPIIPSSRITVVVLGSSQRQCTMCYATQCPLQPSEQ